MKFDFDPQTVDQICDALSYRPWRDVNPLIQSFVQQANSPENRAVAIPSPSPESTPE